MQENPDSELDPAMEQMKESFEKIAQTVDDIATKVESMGQNILNTGSLERSVDRLGRAVNIFLATVVLTGLVSLGMLLYSASQLSGAMDQIEIGAQHASPLRQ